MGPIEGFSTSRRDLRGPTTSKGGLEREMATSEHELLKSKTKTKGKGNLRLQQSSMKLPSMSAVTIRAPNQGIGSGVCVLRIDNERGREQARQRDF